MLRQPSAAGFGPGGSRHKSLLRGTKGAERSLQASWYIARGAKEERDAHRTLEGHVSCDIDSLHDLQVAINL